MNDDANRQWQAWLESGQQFSEQFSEQWRRQMHTGAQVLLSKLDLVTREEFDAQVAVLQRTRAKVEALEEQLAAAEQDQKPAS